MSRFKIATSLCLPLLLQIGASALGAQPPDVVSSDPNGNTAMGTGALFDLTTGYQNTAGGFQALYSLTSGYQNTAVGAFALSSNTTGFYNSAFGPSALTSNTTGSANHAFGINALFSNTTGSDNSALGTSALFSNTTGNANLAFGNFALALNTTGSSNTATGYGSLTSNTVGTENTANGRDALAHNTTGSVNTATGQAALAFNTTGVENTASGGGALSDNTTGLENTASGVNALLANTTGNNSTAFGYAALANSATGNNNTALGYFAGYNVISGSNNIDIGNLGTANDAATIRIGTAGQHVSAYMAGIWGHTVSRGAAVLINSSGQLGVEESSERYKTDIAPAEVSSEKLQQLRAVTYRFKTDSSGERHYGLIAEEVEKVYPELVVRDEVGNIESVRYSELTPVLLTEVQQQQQLINGQAAQLRELRQQFADLQGTAELLQRALSKLQGSESRGDVR